MKNVFVILLLFICLSSSGQIGKTYDKMTAKVEAMMDKYNVLSIEVSGYKFSIGDTLQFTSGSLPNGDFLCTMYSTLGIPEDPNQRLPANYSNQKFIISKIRNMTSGLNTEISIIIYLYQYAQVWIDPSIAISKKEILLK